MKTVFGGWENRLLDGYVGDLYSDEPQASDGEPQDGDEDDESEFDPFAPWTLFFTTAVSVAPNARGVVHYVELSEDGRPLSRFGLCGKALVVPRVVVGWDASRPDGRLCGRCRGRVARHVEGL